MIDNIKEFLGVKDDYKVPEVLLNCLMDSEQQTKLFDQLPEFDKSKDAFYEYFQDEHAQKGALKQEYTPNEIAVLIQRLDGYVSYIEKVGGEAVLDKFMLKLVFSWLMFVMTSFAVIALIYFFVLPLLNWLGG